MVILGAGTEDLKIKLVLDAVSNIGGKVDEAMHDISRLTKATEDAEKRSQQAAARASTQKVGQSGSLFDPNTWSVLMKDQDLFQQRMDRLQRSGTDKMMVGGAMLAPVVGVMKAAGDLEAVMNQIKIDVYDSGDSTEVWNQKVARLRATTIGLSREVKYGAQEIGQAVDGLVRGNVAIEDVANGAARAAVYLAQASKGEISTGASAEAVAKLGNAWQLSGKQLEDTADILARVDAASTASIPNLIEGFKYVSSTASNLKLSVQEVAVSLGVLNNAGIDSSTAGTTLNQLFQHLQPTTKSAQDAFDALGLSVENNPFFDANGRLKPMIEIIRVLRNAMKDMTDQQKQLALKTIFDERGSRAVINLLKEGKNSYEDINDSLGHQMSLWDRIKTQNQGMNAQLEILQSNITTLFGESGSPTAQSMTDFLKKANDITVAMTEWSKANPEVTSGVLNVLGSVGGLTLGVGALQFAVAGLAKVWVPLVATPVGAFLAAVAAAMYLANKASPWLPGTTSYTDRKLQEEQDAWNNRTKLAEIPSQLRAAPEQSWIAKKWEQFNDWYQDPGTKAMPGGTSGNKGPTTINIYPRDANETAAAVRQVLTGDVQTKYQASRMPIMTQE